VPGREAGVHECAKERLLVTLPHHVLRLDVAALRGEAEPPTRLRVVVADGLTVVERHADIELCIDDTLSTRGEGAG
jgi:hypothetical protein